MTPRRKSEITRRSRRHCPEELPSLAAVRASTPRDAVEPSSANMETTAAVRGAPPQAVGVSCCRTHRPPVKIWSGSRLRSRRRAVMPKCLLAVRPTPGRTMRLIEEFRRSRQEAYAGLARDIERAAATRERQTPGARRPCTIRTSHARWVSTAPRGDRANRFLWQRRTRPRRAAGRRNSKSACPIVQIVETGAHAANRHQGGQLPGPALGHTATPRR